jgi:hypothetical protein
LAWKRRVANDRPDLVGEIEQITSGDSPDAHAAIVLIMVSITNRGNKPSIADGFMATVENGPLRLSEYPTLIRPGYKLFGSDGSVVAEFKSGDNIGDKASTPIPVGGRVRGWIKYLFPGISAQKLHVDQGACWTITFNDYLGKEYHISPNPSKLTGHGIMYYPGAEQPFNADAFKRNQQKQKK